MEKADTLLIAMIQAGSIHDDLSGTLCRYDDLLEKAAGSDAAVLPECFNTGFPSVRPSAAENMSGPTVLWMRKRSAELSLSVAGSIMIEENGKIFNRMIWAFPDGGISFYDKGHPFSFSGESAFVEPGESRIIITVKGWKIYPFICYDLRFPEWSRNSLCGDTPSYDCLVYAASWPASRSLAWRTLLAARAIENQAFAVGVNRTGKDGGIDYAGGSLAFSPDGRIISEAGCGEEAAIVRLYRPVLDELRIKFPVLKDIR
ncbi:MAG: nitrilase-related carbon-nitrogen hydrolase [Spirochaetota bacterium]